MSTKTRTFVTVCVPEHLTPDDMLKTRDLLVQAINGDSNVIVTNFPVDFKVVTLDIPAEVTISMYAVEYAEALSDLEVDDGDFS